MGIGKAFPLQTQTSRGQQDSRFVERERKLRQNFSCYFVRWLQFMIASKVFNLLYHFDPYVRNAFCSENPNLPFHFLESVDTSHSFSLTIL